MKRVHCLGILVVDALSRPLERYPVPGEITQVLTDSLKLQPGGGAANTGTALAKLGVPTAVFSKIGNDHNGLFVLESLRKAGVETGGICVSTDDVTPFTYVGIHPDGERTFIHTPGANRTFTLADIDCERFLAADLLLYQDFWALPGVDGAPGAEILAAAKHWGAVTLLDECWGLGPDREVWEMMLPHVDYVLPSRHEMKMIYPDATAEEIVRMLHRKGASNVVLKMGPDGCLVFSGDRLTRVPSRATEIVDTTGAGDCFDAGFIAALAHGLPIVKAAEAGSLAAAACIAHVGGAAGIPPFESLLGQF